MDRGPENVGPRQSFRQLDRFQNRICGQLIALGVVMAAKSEWEQRQRVWMIVKGSGNVYDVLPHGVQIGSRRPNLNVTPLAARPSETAPSSDREDPEAICRVPKDCRV